MELLDPYRFVRLVTMSLGTFWTVAGLLRLRAFAQRWEQRLLYLGFSKGWLRRQVGVVLLRATFLDPLNLGLMLVLVGIWTLGFFVRNAGL